MSPHQIVEGNMIVKMAVKETPALPGNKLKQHYFKVEIDFIYRDFLPSMCTLLFTSSSSCVYVFMSWNC